LNQGQTRGADYASRRRASEQVTAKAKTLAQNLIAGGEFIGNQFPGREKVYGLAGENLQVVLSVVGIVHVGGNK
jgi:hypothetical protein